MPKKVYENGRKSYNPIELCSLILFFSFYCLLFVAQRSKVNNQICVYIKNCAFWYGTKQNEPQSYMINDWWTLMDIWEQTKTRIILLTFVPKTQKPKYINTQNLSVYFPSIFMFKRRQKCKIKCFYFTSTFIDPFVVLLFCLIILSPFLEIYLSFILIH